MDLKFIEYHDTHFTKTELQLFNPLSCRSDAASSLNNVRALVMISPSKHSGLKVNESKTELCLFYKKTPHLS